LAEQSRAGFASVVVPALMQTNSRGASNHPVLFARNWPAALGYVNSLGSVLKQEKIRCFFFLLYLAANGIEFAAPATHAPKSPLFPTFQKPCT